MPNPRQMISDQYDLAQRQITQEFDQMRHMLGQQNLEPEDHDKAYKKMLMQFQQRSDSIFYKTEAQVQTLDQFNDMVKSGVMPQESGEKAKWSVAGVPAEQIRDMFPKEQRPTDWVSEYNENRLLIKNLQDFTNKFEMVDPWYASPRMEFKDPVTDKQRKATEPEIKRYQETRAILDERMAYHRDVLLPNLSVNQRAAGMGRNAMMSQSMGPQQQVKLSNIKKQYNEKTGQTRISHDGGKTWQIQ